MLGKARSNSGEERPRKTSQPARKSLPVDGKKPSEEIFNSIDRAKIIPPIFEACKSKSAELRSLIAKPKEFFEAVQAMDSWELGFLKEFGLGRNVTQIEERQKKFNTDVAAMSDGFNKANKLLDKHILRLEVPVVLELISLAYGIKQMKPAQKRAAMNHIPNIYKALMNIRLETSAEKIKELIRQSGSRVRRRLSFVEQRAERLRAILDGKFHNLKRYVRRSIHEMQKLEARDLLYSREKLLKSNAKSIVNALLISGKSLQQIIPFFETYILGGILDKDFRGANRETINKLALNIHSEVRIRDEEAKKNSKSREKLSNKRPSEKKREMDLLRDDPELKERCQAEINFSKRLLESQALSSPEDLKFARLRIKEAESLLRAIQAEEEIEDPGDYIACPYWQTGDGDDAYSYGDYTRTEKDFQGERQAALDEWNFQVKRPAYYSTDDLDTGSDMESSGDNLDLLEEFDDIDLGACFEDDSG